MPEPKAATTAAKKRNRKPSEFSPKAKITVSVHNSANATVNDGTAAQLAKAFESAGFATRTVHRTREGAGKDAVPSYMVYVAPQGFEFPTSQAKGGVRLDKGTADLLRSIAASMGLDPAKPESIAAVAKALAEKVQTPAS